ncbi:MAG: ketoacyl-ACP synthase III [Kiritimatiellales bacterium]|nr:ketoacyl-ACP synthase III [Kiritimatiellales bacterium]MCF7863684.1 ketoacyl-ACP synthase III [Kiritimatiellales bacterium]
MEPTRTVSIIGTGSYLPEKVLTNRDLEKIVETSDEWIYARTGMRERHIAAADQASSDLGAEAAKKALEDAGIPATEIDLLIVATLSPDMFFPSTACFVQEKIGATNAFCYDLGAACSGFLYALDAAKNQILSGAVKTALVIGSEKMSTFIDWEDRGTCILFGDGAGAAVLRAGGEGRGIMQSAMGSDGSLADLLWTPGGGSRNPATHEMIDQRQQYLKMQGREVFKHAVVRMGEAVLQALEKNNLTVDDIKCFIPHQANIRIIDSIAKRLGIADRIYTNVDKYANTSSAALAIALDEAVKDGTIQKGDLVALTVFGGGFTWGANVLEWGK